RHCHVRLDGSDLRVVERGELRVERQRPWLCLPGDRRRRAVRAARADRPVGGAVWRGARDRDGAGAARRLDVAAAADPDAGIGRGADGAADGRAQPGISVGRGTALAQYSAGPTRWDDGAADGLECRRADRRTALVRADLRPSRSRCALVRGRGGDRVSDAAGAAGGAAQFASAGAFERRGSQCSTATMNAPRTMPTIAAPSASTTHGTTACALPNAAPAATAMSWIVCGMRPRPNSSSPWLKMPPPTHNIAAVPMMLSARSRTGMRRTS